MRSNFAGSRSVARKRKASTIRGIEISAKNFGPISSGKIKLKPLTIFVGPNNSGKSYAATLIHSIMESYAPFYYLKRGPHFSNGRFYGGAALPSLLALSEYTEYRTLIHKQLSGLEQGKEIEISQQLLERLSHRILEEVYERRLSDEIALAFACPLRELVKLGKRSFSLRIAFDSLVTGLSQKRGKLKITQYPDSACKVLVRGADIPAVYKVKERKKSLVIDVGRVIIGKSEREYLSERLLSIILESCISRLFRAAAVRCYYLPAARSGILQGHKALAASIVKRSPSVGLERLEIPKFSGIIADFISKMIALPQERGPLYQLAQDFEKELIKGEIVVR